MLHADADTGARTNRKIRAESADNIQLFLFMFTSACVLTINFLKANIPPTLRYFKSINNTGTVYSTL